MVAVLFTITLIASAAVGGVYVLTEQEIKNQEENAKSAA
jgi:Na+-translocating ferredoxin:NAD+ oxidoreductase RnfG subunit